MRKLVTLLLLAPVLLTFSSNALAQKYRHITIKPYTGKAYSDGSSRSLTANAWAALKSKNYEAVEKYTNKCIKAFSKRALDQQYSLTEFPQKEKAFSYWALNDVATCYFIKAKALQTQNKKEEARQVYETIIKEYSFAQCWDSGGWFWKIAAGAKDQITMMEKNIDYENYASEVLTKNAWNAYNSKNYESANIYADKCIELYKKVAMDQQSSLQDSPLPEGKSTFQFWALNDVATCYFIKGKSLLDQGKKEEAKEIFRLITKDFSHAQCWEPKGWFWTVAEAANDHILSIEKNINFEDYRSSTLAGKAWDALSKGQYDDLNLYADKCIKLYEKKATAQENSILSPVPQDETAHKYWALNDVATCYFIKAKGLYNQSRSKEAKKVFEKIMSKFPHAQCWDPRGWFWSVSVASRDQIVMINEGIDFGDYTSQALTAKAWDAYDKGDLDAAILYSKKCISLYEQEAKRQQSTLQDFASNKDAFNYWALNDVGTCYFIIGKVLFQRTQLREALQAFKKVREEFPYAQCWDPRGWFWKPAIGAQSEADKIESILASQSENMERYYRNRGNVCEHATVHRGYI